MVHIGSIKPVAPTQSGHYDRVCTIDSHPVLSRSPERAGINPFTKAPAAYKAAADESRILVVWSGIDARTAVAVVARKVASRLGWRYEPVNAA